MKKLILFLAIVFIASADSIAQSTLTAANSNPVAGDKIYLHMVKWDTATPGRAGAGVTWDYSNDTIFSPRDSTSYWGCTSTICGAFPGATLYSFSSYAVGDTNFNTANASAFTWNGYGGASERAVLQDPVTLMRYPMTYGTNYVTNAYMPGTVTWLRRKDSVVCDGYGTLILQGRTDTGVLRVHTYTQGAQRLRGSTDSFIIDDYSFYKPGFHSPILSISFDTSRSTFKMIAFWYRSGKMATTAVASISTASTSLNLYPNPASGNVTISFSSLYGADEEISVTDMTGRVVLAQQLKRVQPGDNKCTLTTEYLPAGKYLVRKHTDAGDMVTSLVIQP